MSLAWWPLVLAAAFADSIEVGGRCDGLLVQELEEGRGTYAHHYWVDLQVRRRFTGGRAVLVDLRVQGQEESPAVRLRGISIAVPLASLGQVRVGAVEARWGRGGYYPGLWLDSHLWDTGLVTDVRVWGVALHGRFEWGACDVVGGASGEGNEAVCLRISRGIGWAAAGFESKDSTWRSRGWVVGGGLASRWFLLVAGYRTYTVAPFPERRDRTVLLAEVRTEQRRCTGATASLLLTSEGAPERTCVEGMAELGTRLGEAWSGAGRAKAWASGNSDPVWLAVEPVVRWEPVARGWVELGHEVGIPSRGPLTHTLRGQAGCAF